jgi:hypothetical protein
MKSKFLFSIFLIALIILGLGCQGEVPEPEQIDYEKDIKPLIEENSPGHKVRGSCNVIAQASHCMDYIGSLWTEEQMKLNCGGAGVFSLDACPYSENGGCLNGRDTIGEDVIWSYPYGGQPITGEDLKYESMACDALEVSEWVTPDSLFLE